jgi:hypothetical protein
MKFKDIVQLDIQKVFFNQNELADQILYNQEPTLGIFELIQTNKQGNGYDTKGGSADFSYFWLNMEQRPKNGDEIIYNSTTYQVNKIVEQHNNVYKVEVTSNESPMNGRMTGRWSS